MPVPNPRCIICDKRIEEWDPQRGQHPKYDSLACQKQGRKNPICGRCKQPFTPEHFSQRFHPVCAQGCKVCGAPLRERAQGESGGHLRPQYCTEECQEHAWEGTPLPVCFKCKKPVPLPKPPRALRNPPKMHAECRPDYKRLTAEQIEEQRRTEAAKAAAKKAKRKKEPTAPKHDTRKAPWDE